MTSVVTISQYRPLPFFLLYFACAVIFEAVLVIPAPRHSIKPIHFILPIIYRRDIRGPSSIDDHQDPFPTIFPNPCLPSTFGLSEFVRRYF
jgi:hypothetical protein